MTHITEKTWPTEEQDLSIAADIINKHVGENHGQPLEMIKIVIDKNKQQAVDVHMSDWISEMVEYFREKYGYEHGHAIIGNILTKLYLQHETLH